MTRVAYICECTVAVDVRGRVRAFYKRLRMCVCVFECVIIEQQQ